MSTIVTRAGKGSALTHNEVDANFTNLNTDKLQSGDTAASLTITSADINGGTIDGTAIGNSSASSGAFTTLSSTGNTTLGDSSANTVTINGTVQPGVVVSGSSSGDALRITQEGTGNALVVEDSANPDSTPFIVDSSGRLVVGYTSASPATLPNVKNMQSHSTGGAAGYTAVRWDDGANGPQLLFGKSRGGAIGTLGIVSNGDILGQIYFCGDDGTDLVTPGVQIIARVDGAPGANDMPGRLEFFTTANGDSTSTKRMQIDSTGLITLESGSGLSISATGVTSPAATDGNVFSGAYTPSLTNTTNVTSSTPQECQYMRVGNVVTVSGQVLFTATSANADTQVDMTLPIASNLTASRQLGGAGGCINTGEFGESVGIIGVAATDTAAFRCRPTVTTSQTYNFSFTYQVL